MIDHEASIDPIGWKSSKSLRDHFNKHGKKEMGLDSKSDYLEIAEEFFRVREGPSLILRRQKSGDYFKYNFETREFGILNSDFQIVTYYQLDSNYRSPEDFQEYLSDQIGR